MSCAPGGGKKRCACDTCVAAHRQYAAIYNEATREAAKWVRARYRGVFDELLDEAHERRGLIRRPPGRPGVSVRADGR